MMYLLWYLTWSAVEALCALMSAALWSDWAFMVNLQTVMFYSGSATNSSSVHKRYTPPRLFHNLFPFLLFLPFPPDPPSHLLGHLIPWRF